MIKIKATGPGETKKIGQCLGKLLRPGDVICLSGDLGAGKTVFAKGLAMELGVREQDVSSPTFTIINIYEGNIPLYHFDVYRIEQIEEMDELGYEEYFSGDGVTVIEWPEKIRDLLPANFIDVVIAKDPADENTRLITIKPVGEKFERVLRELTQICGFSH